MKLAIMQPYIFPYIGYFQLIQAVDKFVFYDDVNFIKQGWVNRNRILLNGKEHLFSVPLVKQSSFSKISEIDINKDQYSVWKKKFYKTLNQAYKKAPYFNQVYALIETVLEDDCESIGSLAKNSIRKTCEYLKIEGNWKTSSTDYQNDHFKGQERVLDICKKENASVYINPIGGMSLYSKDDFAKNRLQLYFIKSKKMDYSQNNRSFVPWLSIVDVMMFNEPGRVLDHLLLQYELV